MMMSALPPTRSRMRLGIRILASFGALLVVAVLALVWFSRDAPVQTQSNLAALQKTIPDSQNAIVLFHRAAEESTLQSDPTVLLKPGAWNSAQASTLIAQNRAALISLNAAAGRGQAVSLAFMPDVQDFETYTKKSTAYTSKLRMLTGLQRVNAELEFRAGRTAEAWNLLINVLQSGALLTQHPATLIEYLTGVSIQRKALDDLLKALPRGLPEGVQLPTAPMDNPRAMFEGEFYSYGLALQIVTRQSERFPQPINRNGLQLPLVGAYLFQPNRTLEGFERFKTLILEDARSCPAGNRYAEAVTQMVDVGGLFAAFRPNRVGAILWQVLLPNSNAPVEARCQMHLRASVLRTEAALYRFQKSTGRLPDRLEELPPSALQTAFDPYATPNTRLEWNAKERALRSKSGERFKLGF
jgi:hypothetical protein